MSYDDETYDELKANFELLESIISPKAASVKSGIDLSNVEEIINKKIPDALRKSAPENAYTLYEDFKAEYSRFKDFILYDKLIGKSVVALGGGFSSGKSSFLNSLLGEDILPADLDPSTSVPTYIISGEEEGAVGINVFDAKVSLYIDDLKYIAHGFGKIDDEDGNKTEPVTLGHILESIFCTMYSQPYEGIAFLDTPGYSKPDSEQYSAKTDENIARRQLNSSNYILWFVQADAGTITDADIDFIKTLNDSIPILIVLNKADRKVLKDLKLIIEKIRQTLMLKGVRTEGVLAFTSRMDQIEDEDQRKFIADDIEKLKKHLTKWNGQKYVSNFARNFKRLFMKCREFYEEEIKDDKRKLSQLNTSLTLLSAQDIDDEPLHPLRSMVQDLKEHINEVTDIRDYLKGLQDDFFREIKFIADKVNISMPEPSEIDLIKEERDDNPKALLEKYMRDNGIKTGDSIKELLNNSFKDLRPKAGSIFKRMEEKTEMVNLMEKACDIKPDNIHLTDSFTETEDYKRLLATVRA